MAKRTRTREPRPSVFDAGYSRYGYTEERGDPDVWAAAFGEAMDGAEVEEILGADSPWIILNLKPGSKMPAIKVAYRRLVQKWHPDKWQGADNKAKAEAKFKRIHAAYVKLGGRR